jgi:hypothetical protein
VSPIAARTRVICDVTDPEGKLIAKAMSTCTVLRGDQANCKDWRLNIRLSSKDLEAIRKRALEEGLPYQTLISSLLHKYAAGRLKEV